MFVVVVVVVVGFWLMREFLRPGSWFVIYYYKHLRVLAMEFIIFIPASKIPLVNTYNMQPLPTFYLLN